MWPEDPRNHQDPMTSSLFPILNRMKSDKPMKKSLRLLLNIDAIETNTRKMLKLERKKKSKKHMKTTPGCFSRGLSPEKKYNILNRGKENQIDK